MTARGVLGSGAKNPGHGPRAELHPTPPAACAGRPLGV